MGRKYKAHGYAEYKPVATEDRKVPEGSACMIGAALAVALVIGVICYFVFN